VHTILHETSIKTVWLLGKLIGRFG